MTSILPTPMHMVYFSVTSNEIPILGQAVQNFNSRIGPMTLAARTRTQLSDNPEGCRKFIDMALKAHVVVITLMAGKQSCPAWEDLLCALDQAKKNGDALPYLHIQPTGSNLESLEMVKAHSRGVESGIWTQLNQFYRFGGGDNLFHMLICLSNKVLGTNHPMKSPIKLPNHGIYHPNLDHVPDPDTYFKSLDPGKPTIGIWFYQNFWTTDNKAHIDGLINEAELQGANVIAVFHTRFKDKALGQEGADYAVNLYFRCKDKSRIDVLINPVMFSLKTASPDYKGLLEKLNIPVIQALTTSRPIREWEESDQGLATMDITIGVAQPELDGVIIGVPVAAKEFDGIDPVTGSAVNKYRPIPERIQRLTTLALNWARLGRMANSKKKVAVVFHNYPPRNDRIGCASGLDSFESIRLLLEDMSCKGYMLEKKYDSGDDLAWDLLSRMTCDQRWMLPEQMAKRACATAGPDQYMDWHRLLPKKIIKKMSQDWGPMPGDLFVHDHKLLFPGLINGNVFLTVQPPRGQLEQIDKDYHDPLLSPPHHYLAFYRWIKEVFGAHLIIHVGKHGSLEWLPGKAVGLGPHCFPDLAIADLPNIYPYIINDPGEGTQAKRRSNACIVDHMPPAMTHAGLYGDLAELDQLMDDYQETALEDPARRARLEPMIWEAVVSADLDKEMDITLETARADFKAFMGNLHARLNEISHTTILTGLHILGQAPKGEDLVNTLIQLTRLSNGSVPSLQKSVIRALGHDPKKVLDFNQDHNPVHNPVHNPNHQAPAPHGNDRVLDRAHQICLDMMGTMVRDLAPDEDHEKISGRNRSKTSMEDKINQVVEEYLGKTDPNVSCALVYALGDLWPRLNQTPEERRACIKAMDGQFVPPGPSGAPSRGRADLVPAGKNFYSVDPQKIPSPLAWKTGKALARSLIRRYQKEHNDYPDTVGIILWASPTMRTKGDDVAQILYLLGVRPVWQKGSGNVRGVEVIPLSKLGRPRIDVTPKISGMFRDAFPLLMDLIDKAVQMVAKLKEPIDSNFIRRHVQIDAAFLENQGTDSDTAFRQASFRIFGAAPGSYGTGVTQLVESKKWETDQDLGEMFIRCSSHAYGQNVFGRPSESVFRRVLNRVQVSVKNEDSREKDMMTCTDFYGYHGGFIAAVKAVKGKAPLSLSGDSSDPEQVLVRTTKEEAQHLFRARLLNPKWLEGLKAHGYKGAGDLSKAMDIIFGWDATAGVVDDHLYQRFAQKTVLDPDMAQWMKSVNPYALENMVSKLLEAHARKMWQAEAHVLDQLTQTYLDVEGQVEEING